MHSVTIIALSYFHRFNAQYILFSGILAIALQFITTEWHMRMNTNVRVRSTGIQYYVGLRVKYPLKPSNFKVNLSCA
jgi:hypothetical protein